MNFTVMPWLILVAFSKKAAKEKLNLGSGIILQTAGNDDLYRLQYGTVVQVGPMFQRPYKQTGLPDLAVGDTLIVHHGIERDVDNLIHQDEENEYRIVRHDGHNVLGFEKPDGTFFCDYNHVWCKDVPKVEEKITAGRIILPTLNTEKLLREQVDNIDTEIKIMQDSSGNTAPIIQGLKQDGEIATKKLNKKYIHPLTLHYFNPCNHRFENLQQGEQIYMEGWIDYKGYPLNYKGEDFLIVKANIVVGVQTERMLQPI